MNHFIKSLYFPKAFVVEPTFSSGNRSGEKISVKREIASGRDLSRLQNEKAKNLNLRFGQLPNLTKEEKYITVERVYKNLFPKNLKIVFKPGINLIVGENGCGKTTVLNEINRHISGREVQSQIICDELTKKNFFGWDFEKDNPVTNERMRPNPDDSQNFLKQTFFLMSADEESHGETTRGCLDAFLRLENSLIVFDEPETALSLTAQYEYWGKLKKLSENNQIIMITHSKVFIEEAGEVYDMEKKKWVESAKYIKRIRTKNLK